MHELLEKVTRELEKIGDKGLTSSNLDTTYKLIDIYKDIKESLYYEKMCEKSSENIEKREYELSQDYMVESVELAMSSFVKFIEALYEHLGTQKEREIIHTYLDKLKKY